MEENQAETPREYTVFTDTGIVMVFADRAIVRPDGTLAFTRDETVIESRLIPVGERTDFWGRRRVRYACKDVAERREVEVVGSFAPGKWQHFLLTDQESEYGGFGVEA